MHTKHEDSVRDNLSQFGHATLKRVLSSGECNRVAAEIATLYRGQEQGVIESESRQMVGGRNLQAIWDGWKPICQVPAVKQLLIETLGEQFGLVRILFFDKPPGQSWNLAVHRDRTISVSQHHEPPDPYSKPTLKAGVPHVVADDSLLEQMVTLRLHLDAMHENNGPLIVVPGSHRDRERSDKTDTVEVHCGDGDVFVMRPLLLHGSRSCSRNCGDHRRVVHMEFAPLHALQAPYHWHRFDRVM